MTPVDLGTQWTPGVVLFMIISVINALALAFGYSRLSAASKAAELNSTRITNTNQRLDDNHRQTTDQLFSLNRALPPAGQSPQVNVNNAPNATEQTNNEGVSGNGTGGTPAALAAPAEGDAEGGPYPEDRNVS